MRPSIKKVATSDAPKAVGPYSQAIITSSEQGYIFVSGQIPLDPMTGKLVEGDIRVATKQVLDNIEAILLAAGSTLQGVVRTDVFLKDLKRDFTQMNEEYGKRFTGEVPPARQTIQVAELPLGAIVEISCIAVPQRGNKE